MLRGTFVILDFSVFFVLFIDIGSINSIVTVRLIDALLYCKHVYMIKVNIYEMGLGIVQWAVFSLQDLRYRDIVFLTIS